MAATKTASVNVRIDQTIKAQAEAILEQIGLPRAVAIDAFYRQIIIHGGIPFSLTIPSAKTPAFDEMNAEQFNLMMETGIAQAKAGDSFDVDEVFDEIEARLETK